MCMRFRNSCGYFGLGQFSNDKICHPERRLSPRSRHESKSRDLFLPELSVNGPREGSDDAGNSRSFDSGKELASESLPPLKMTVSMSSS